MKASEIQLSHICEQCRLMEEDVDEAEQAYLNALQAAAKAYVRAYTGLKDDEIDRHEDLTIAVLVLISDMYDNRQNYVDKSNVNQVVDTILGLHCVNFLPKTEGSDGN